MGGLQKLRPEKQVKSYQLLELTPDFIFFITAEGAILACLADKSTKDRT
jgi:hypothetical protein